MPLIFKKLLCLLLLGSGTVVLARDRFAPMAIGPQHYFYYAYPNYVPDSARVKPSGGWSVDLDYNHLNIIGQSTNVGDKIGVGGQTTGLDFEFEHCGYYGQDWPINDWSCKSQGYSIRQDGEVLRQGWRGTWGLGGRFELQATAQEVAFQGGELDQFIEDFHLFIDMGNDGRSEFPRNEFGVYIWDNEALRFVYRMDPHPEPGYRAAARTYALKFGLVQGDSVAIALRYGTAADQQALRFNQVTDQQQANRDGADRMWALDTSIQFDGWAFHWGYGQTQLAQPFLPLSPSQLLFQFYGLIWLWGSDAEVVFQDLTYTSLFPKDGRETLYHALRERTVGYRTTWGDAFSWKIGMANNVTWEANNIDVSFFTGFGLQY